MNTTLEHPGFDRQEALLADQALEIAIIATALNFPAAMAQASDLQPWHFSFAMGEVIWKEMQKLAAHGEEWNVVTVNTATGSKYQKWLGQCVASTRSLQVRKDCDIIIDFANRRRLVESAERQIEAARMGKTAGEIAAIAKRAADETIASRDPFLTGRQATEQLIEDMSKARKPRSTGIELLDRAMEGGMNPGEMYVLGGRKKTGKTMFAGTLSYNLSQQGVKHLYIAAEMGAKRIQQRLMARQMAVSPKAFRQGAEGYNQTLTEMAHQMRVMEDSVYFYNAPGVTIDQVKQAVATAVMKYGIEGFIVDYWQIIAKPQGANPVEHGDFVAQEIANLAEQFGVWNWTLSQINQEGNTRGGEGARNACTMMFEMHRPDKTESAIWFEMKETRNTEWADIGSKEAPVMMIDGNGPFIREMEEHERPAPKPRREKADDFKPRRKGKKSGSMKDMLDDETPNAGDF